MKMTVKEVATLTGVSVRTLHYYHREGILIPSEITGNKYRYYDAANLAQLQNILFLRELDFSIQEIKGILADPTMTKWMPLKNSVTCCCSNAAVWTN